MFYSGVLTDGSRKEMEIREAAALRQQRRMKQAVQFLHKDSADLLPLDGLKKLGTSKEMQPHNILQRRLLETNLSRFRMNNRGTRLPNNAIHAQSNGFHHSKPEGITVPEEEDLIFVCCKCSGREIKVLIDTGCKYNFISTACLDRLGLKESVNANKIETDNLLFSHRFQAMGQIEKVSLMIGHVKVDCSVIVVENDRNFMSLGSKTLKSLKCVIDTEKRVLVLGRVEKDQVQFVDGKDESQGDSSPGI
ncbi:nuclear receptor-interacting protein 3 [Lepisosteus oculatus]|uniref:Nuclear receptor interacting protein 3 n=1 Tax=Lepisosteus oculatus TaxID=7918 RepID=W5M6W1_LEPOC|nr:PREDICTED: nuclear receptor-interacting protein 3 [Lepisosteus oculatus]